MDIDRKAERLNTNWSGNIYVITINDFNDLKKQKGSNCGKRSFQMNKIRFQIRIFLGIDSCAYFVFSNKTWSFFDEWYWNKCNLI